MTVFCFCWLETDLLRKEAAVVLCGNVLQLFLARSHANGAMHVGMHARLQTNYDPKQQSSDNALKVFSTTSNWHICYIKYSLLKRDSI